MPSERLKSATGLAATARRLSRIVPMVALAIALMFVNLIQILSLCIRPFSPIAFRRVNRWCANTWWGACVAMCECLNNARLVVTGDDLPERENAIVVSNHQQMPDIVVLMMLARSKQCLGDLKFFVKDVIKWVPGIGWGMRFLDCVFVRRNWSSDQESILQTFNHLVSDHIPMWLVSFVEGTRLTPKKLAASQGFARKRGQEPTQHVLLPRTKGFAATIVGLRMHATAVYDLTIGYLNGVPSLWQFGGGEVKDVHVHVRRHAMDDLPEDDAALRAWLLERFYEKDRLLKHFEQHCEFPQV